MKKVMALLICAVLLNKVNGQPPEVSLNKNYPADSISYPFLDTVRVSLVIGMKGKYLEDVMGYDVRKHTVGIDDPQSGETIHMKYLDYREHDLPKNITVWMSKELKQ